ncbi:MAG: hypothetical protein ACO1QS_19910 [Verrucomicrobiota bacterium]
MPSPQRRRYVAIAAIAFLLVVSFVLVSWRNQSQWSVELDDGTTLTILDVATAPNEAIYAGAPWKRPFAETFKGVGHNFKKNFGLLSVTNESAITWQWRGNNAKMSGTQQLVDKIRLVDAAGKEHQTFLYICFPASSSSTNGPVCGVLLLGKSLKPPAYLRIYQANITNEFRLGK